jgi:large subunit ribosomal protein L5
MNPMQDLRITKIVVHMGVGESGEKLSKAEEVLSRITDQKPVKAMAKKTQPAFGTRKGSPIGCKVTLRGDAAESFFETSLGIVERKLPASHFDGRGTFSFGIEEHTDFPGMSYDPSIGIFGMDVNVVLEKRGARISRRKAGQRRLPQKQRVNREEAIRFLQEHYKVEVR